MLKVTLVLGIALAVFVAESSCQKFILPTYRPSTRNNIILPTYRPPTRTRPPIRYVREAGTEELSEPLIENSDAIELSQHNERYVRSVDSPSAKRGGGSHTTSSGSRNTGPTHPGYNRRNAREIRLPGHLNPLRPKPLYPRPTFPAPVPKIPILARTARDIQIPGVRKPTHRDVIIPNWNPHVKTNPWQRIGGRRNTRSIEFEDFDLENHRERRDVSISGIPELKKPTHRDVIIPNWNPHVRTNPWQRLGGGKRH